MSRALFFGRNHVSEGEASLMIDRGWMLAGNPSVNGGGSTTLTLTDAQALQPWMQFGRMVLVNHPRLPNWAGMLDTPWSIASPVQVTAYNMEYLLSLRMPDTTMTLSGSVGQIAARIIELCNAGDDLFLRIGDVSRADPTTRQATLDDRNYWEQFKSLLERSGAEMQVRPEKDADGRLVIYLDIAQRLGLETNYLYYTRDENGRTGNAILQGGTYEGKIVNQVVGMNDQSDPVSRLYSPVYLDEASARAYRLRSEKVQFRGVVEQSTLNLYSQNYLSYARSPKLSFVLHILDKGEAFQNARLGNTAYVHLPDAILPGGTQGWRGLARILAMAYSESSNLLTVKMETL
jgi:hypothetical protein